MDPTGGDSRGDLRVLRTRAAGTGLGGSRTAEAADGPLAILEPTRPRSLPRVWAWIATLVAVPTLISILVARHPSGPAAGVVDYLSRPTEAFVAALLLHAYFSALLPWLERRAGGIPAG